MYEICLIALPACSFFFFGTLQATLEMKKDHQLPFNQGLMNTLVKAAICARDSPTASVNKLPPLVPYDLFPGCKKIELKSYRCHYYRQELSRKYT